MTVALVITARPCLTECVVFESAKTGATSRYHASSTRAEAIGRKTAHCCVGKEKIGVFSPRGATTRRREYLPPIYAPCFRPEMQGPETAKVAIGTRQRVSHQAAWTSFDPSMVSLSSAVHGSLTLLNRVMEKSSGEVPLRGGRRIEMTPGNGSQVLQIGTMKGRMPRSSPLMIRRAMTSAVLLMPNVGVDAAINLGAVRDWMALTNRRVNTLGGFLVGSV